MRATKVVSSLFAALAMGATSPGAALAQAQGKAKFTKSEHAVEGIAQTELTKPKQPVKDDKPKGPTITLDDFVGQRTTKIKEINDRAIEKMERLTKITPDDSPEKADFQFRLAESYSENQRFYNFQARSLDEKIFQAKGGEKATLERQQKQHEQDEKKWLLKAVGAYVAAAQFKKYERMDVVLFKLAYLLQTIKKEDQAREFFLRLIKEYPNSKFVPDAYLSFAEFYFNKGEMDAAMKFYEKVRNYPDAPVYGYAYYKMGWCQINLGQFKPALQIFIDVIRLARQGKAGTNKAANLALEKEAKKDVVRAFARVPGATPDKAWELFSNVGGDYAPKMMESLADLYYTQGMFKDSSQVYHKLMALSPDSPRLCEWQNKIVNNTLSSSTKKEQVQEINRLGIAFDRVQKMPNVKQDVKNECRNAFHDIAKELALVWHKEASRTKNPDTYALVKFVYRDYLERFAKEKGAYEMAFYYSEVLWKTSEDGAGNWRETAEAYTRVVELDPKGKYGKEAAYAAVLAWKNALNIDDVGAAPDAHKNNKPMDIPPHWQKMIQAFDTYIKYVPDSPELPKIRYRKARVYYEHNQFDLAAKYFEEVVTHHPKDELAIYSANLLLDALNAAGKHKELIRWVDKFMTNDDLMKDQEFAKQLVTIKVDSLENEAIQYKKRGDFKNCAVSMLAAADSLPESPKHATRLYDAGTCFTEAHLIGRAVGVRSQLIDKHPGDNLAKKALYQIANNFHQLAAYQKAADNYEAFATKFPGEKEAPASLGNALNFRMGLGDKEKAFQNMNDYIKFYGAKRASDAAGVFFQMATVYEKEGKNDDLIKHLDAYLKKWGKDGGIDRQIFAHFRLGELLWNKSCSQESVHGSCIKLERVSATGRQKALYELNRRIADKKKKLKEPERTTCGAPTRSKITVFDRNKGAAAQAKAHFDTALKLFANGDALKKVPAGPDADARGFTATAAAAGSRFYQGEGLYEDFLRLKFPEGMELQPPNQFDTPKKAKVKKDRYEADTKKFAKYMTDKAVLLQRLAGASVEKKGIYDSVLDFKNAHWTIAASARIGQVWANFSDQLLTAEIPKFLKKMNEWGMNERELYCDQLVDKAEPLEMKAADAYGVCLKAATQQSWFNEWSNMCEVELNQMRPSEYPLSAEDKPEAGYVSTLMTPAPIMTELPSSVQAVGPQAGK